MNALIVNDAAVETWFHVHRSSCCDWSEDRLAEVTPWFPGIEVAANDNQTGTPTRGLVIVGASHKPYLEGYLYQMNDMSIVDADGVLR